MYTDADGDEGAGNGLGALTTWQPIFHAENQVVLYNPTNHALAIRASSVQPREQHCPYCSQPLPPGFQAGEAPTVNIDDHSRASNYFHLLAIANETWSRPSTPPPPIESGNAQAGPSTFTPEALADGYFKAFFVEEQKLGMGANGSVFLCQHVLDGNALGHFAVKKVAVGESHSYLINILREVRLLERLHHPNIITYHHSWLESTQFSNFGPKVPTLHILMQWAEGGSLDDFIDVRLGRETHAHLSPSSSDGDPDLLSRSARIRAYKMYQRASPEEKERLRRRMDSSSNTKYRQTWTAVHLLSAEEAKSLFGDVVEGLAFLHSKSILHLDLKPGNVLLTWDEGRLIPRAMLSDFGTSRDMINTPKMRSGNTGTLEYSSPESLPSPQTGVLQQVTSKADMWSLGMILHRLLFFKLPYHYAASGDASSNTVNSMAEDDKMSRLEAEILSYPGFKSSSTISSSFETRSLPRTFLILLESLLNPLPEIRPSSERVLSALREGRLDPVKARSRTRPASTTTSNETSLMPVIRRHSSADSRLELPPTPTPVQTPQTESSNAQQVDEKPSLLTLPLPEAQITQAMVVDRTIPRHLTDNFVWVLKIYVMILKLLHVTGKFPGHHEAMSIAERMRSSTFVGVVFLASLDPMFEGLTSTVLLALVHIFIARMASRT